MNDELTGVVTHALASQLEVFRDQVRELVEPLSEPEFWRNPIEPGNSVGHLILHLTGNLSFFVGTQLGATGYVRDRDREFIDPNPPSKAEALARLDETVAMFRRIVSGLTSEQLMAPHPTERLGSVVNGLINLIGHFAMHRGQMSYLVRLVRR